MSSASRVNWGDRGGETRADPFPSSVFCRETIVMGETPTDHSDRSVRASPIAIACRSDVVRRACMMSAIVGTLLMLINHGDALWTGGMTSGDG